MERNSELWVPGSFLSTRQFNVQPSVFRSLKGWPDSLHGQETSMENLGGKERKLG